MLLFEIFSRIVLKRLGKLPNCTLENYSEKVAFLPLITQEFLAFLRWMKPVSIMKEYMYNHDVMMIAVINKILLKSKNDKTNILVESLEGAKEEAEALLSKINEKRLKEMKKKQLFF